MTNNNKGNQTDPSASEACGLKANEMSGLKASGACGLEAEGALKASEACGLEGRKAGLEASEACDLAAIALFPPPTRGRAGVGLLTKH